MACDHSQLPAMKMPRKYSMSRRSDFSRVRAQGKSKAGRNMVLSVLRQEELEHFKVGIIVTKKVGKAHQRNFFRRRVRSLFQKHGETLENGCYYVVIGRWRAVTASYAELEKEWLYLTKKLKVRQG